MKKDLTLLLICLLRHADKFLFSNISALELTKSFLSKKNITASILTFSKALSRLELIAVSRVHCWLFLGKCIFGLSHRKTLGSCTGICLITPPHKIDFIFAGTEWGFYQCQLLKYSVLIMMISLGKKDTLWRGYNYCDKSNRKIF